MEEKQSPEERNWIDEVVWVQRACLYMCSLRYACAYICENLLSPPAVGGGRGAGCRTGESCHVFMLTNELITQPLI